MKYKVYCLRDINDIIVYVGCTKRSLEKRFKEHIKEKNLISSDYKIELITAFDNPKDMFQLEYMLIEHYKLQYTGLNLNPGNPKRISSTYITSSKSKVKKLTRKSWVPTEEQKQRLKTLRCGYKNSPEHQKILVESRKRKVLCIETGKIYSSAKQAAEELNLQRSKISAVCKGKRITTGKLHFKFIDV